MIDLLLPPCCKTCGAVGYCGTWSRILNLGYWVAWGLQVSEKNKSFEKQTDRRADAPGRILPSHLRSRTAPLESRGFVLLSPPVETSGAVLLRNQLGPHGLLSLQFLFLLKTAKKNNLQLFCHASSKILCLSGLIFNFFFPCCPF